MPARTLEVINDGESHFVLLDGEGAYELPAGNYRVEAYHGLFWEPVAEDFVLKAGERRWLTLTLRPLDDGKSRGWVSGDDHIHLTRAAEDDEVFVRWLQADDLSVGNFLQLQRQVDAAVQYAFGRDGGSRRAGRHDPLGPGVAQRVLRAYQPAGTGSTDPAASASA